MQLALLLIGVCFLNETRAFQSTPIRWRVLSSFSAHNQRQQQRQSSNPQDADPMGS
eukprot:CAMPEP_0172470534 /NCGR_PEP_ID=MMETSP1065-20121228/66601_1 /TAXON_ID=265537 /ORGANISM="Amphiprora paludosa, Strain CCMP125" /LENGTH=55 /DNA_ID=CAMNT_0013228505 /DNA_START=1 /DNA_END=165 /DNA_ORIENTATION=+